MALNDIKVPKENAQGTFDEVVLTPAQIGAQASGDYATLVNGLVPSNQLPSFVDDVLEFANLAAFPATGESGKIFVAIDTRKTFRWSGSTYVEISPSEVTSVAGRTGAITLSNTDISGLGTASTKDAPATGNASSTQVVLGNDTRLSDSRNANPHAAAHASSGSDPLTPSDIGAQSVFVVEQLTITTSAQVNLTAARAKIFDIVQYAGQQVDVKLPSTNAQNADTFVFRWATGSDSIQIINSGSPSPITTVSPGQQVRLIRGTTDNWTVVPVDTHEHAASAITSGTLAHERGGLEADVSAYNGLLKISGGATSAVTVSATGESVIGAADAAAARSAISAAAATHTHPSTDITGLAASATTDTTNASNITSGTLAPARMGTGTPSASNYLRGDGSWQTVASGGVTSGSVDNAILRADGVSGSQSQGSDLVIDDATTTTQNNVAIRNNHSLTDSALVLTPKGTGAFIVGPKPDGTSTGGNARGSGAICIQTSRTAATQVASTANSIAIGNRSTSSNGETIAIGFASLASGNLSTCVGANATATNTYACAFGNNADATNSGAIAIGDRTTSSSSGSIMIGSQGAASGDRAIAIGEQSTATGAYSVAMGFFASAPLRGQFACYPFSSVYWAGTTTNNTPTVLSLDGTAGNRFTIAASTALAVDILLVARRTGTQDKWLVARRFLGIRRDATNTALIGTVQTIGVDQPATGGPSWSFTLTADTTNNALQLEVTGATGETVEWRATAFYRSSS